MGPGELAVEFRSEPDGVVLVAAGDLDMATVDALVDPALAALRDHPAMLSVDLAGVGFCDSAGINALVKIRRACDESRSAFRVVNPQPTVRRVLVDLTGLGGLLNIPPERIAGGSHAE